MNKQEYEAKKDELANKFYIQSNFVPTEWAVMNFKAGFEHGYQLAQAEIEELINSLTDLMYDNPNRDKDIYNQGVRSCQRRMKRAITEWNSKHGGANV